MEYYNFKTYIPRGSKQLRDNVVVLTKNHITLVNNLQQMVKEQVALKYDPENKIICIDLKGNGLKIKKVKLELPDFINSSTLKIGEYMKGKSKMGAF